MGEFSIGDRVRRKDDAGHTGTVEQYTEEPIGPKTDRYLIVRWDGTEADSRPVHESEFEHADD
jgi:hypothetical protein